MGVLTGTEGDATPFTDVTVANVSSTLHKIGFQKHGNEVMYSGHTGRMLNTKVRRRGVSCIAWCCAAVHGQQIIFLLLHRGSWFVRNPNSPSFCIARAG